VTVKNWGAYLWNWLSGDTTANLKPKIVPVDSDGDEKFTATNPASVVVTGSNVAIPVDIQYNQLTEAEALPVKVAGSNVKESSSEKLTVDATVGGISLTPAKYGAAKKVFITVETGPIRIWVDKTAPTATDGHLYNIGDQIMLETAGEIANFKIGRAHV